MNAIVYLHGYGSSGQSGTVAYLRKRMPEYNILAPDIPVSPREALPFLRKYCEENNADLIIGTSMGGIPHLVQAIENDLLLIIRIPQFIHRRLKLTFASISELNS